MNFKKIFWSIVLIAAGVIVLGNNAGWFHLSWDDILPFIYVAIIILGVSILPIKDSIKLITSGVILIAALFVFIFAEPRDDRPSLKHIFENSDWIYDNDDLDDDDDILDDDVILDDNNNMDDNNSMDNNGIMDNDDTSDNDKTQRYSRHGKNNYPQAMISYAHETEVDFDITASAGSYSIGSSKESGNLLNLNQSGPTCAYSLTSEDIGRDRKKIDFSISGAIDKSKIDSTKYNLQLNTHPVWNFDIDSGAASINIDGRDIKIKNIDIEQGVASTNIVVGKRYHDVNISVSSGVSTLKIKIPEDAYCKINNEGALNLKNLKGFSNKGDGIYIYNEKSANPSCRININLETALSSLNVEPY